MRKLSPGVIFKLAPMDVVRRGIRYFEEGRAFEAMIEDDVLFVEVEGSDYYTVEFVPADEGFQYRCDCPAFEGYGRCKHIICALMTIKEILEPGTYPNAPFSEKKARLLRDELEGNPIEDEPISEEISLPVVFSSRADDYDAIRLATPKENIFAYFWSVFDDFVHALSDGMASLTELRANQNRLFFESLKDRLVPLSVVGPEGIVPHIRLSLKDHRVEFYFGLKKDNRAIQGHLYHNKYLIDTTDRTITVVDIPEVDLLKTALWDRKAVRVLLPQVKKTTLRRLQENPILLDDRERDLLEAAEWKVNSRVVTPLKASMQFAINMERLETGAHLMVKFMGILQDGTTIDIHPIITETMGWLLRGSLGPLRSKANRKRFLSILHEALVRKSKRSIRAVMKDIDNAFLLDLKRFNNNTVAYYRAHFHDLIDFFLRGQHYLTINNTNWTLVSLDKRALLDMLFRFFEVLGFPAQKEVGPWFIMVREDHLWKNFSKLYEAMSDASVQITYNRRPIRRSRWNVSLEVTSGID
jgi:hypothetical protein